MKYLLFPATPPLTVETPILFPDFVEHKVMHDALRAKGWPQATSGGFVKFGECGDAICWGVSDSTGLTSKPVDSVFVDVCL